MEDIGINGMKDLLRRLKFGDIVVNHWASDNNPHKQGVFVRLGDGTLIVTDMNGNFWEPMFNSCSRIEIIGSVINSNAGSTPDR